MKKKYFLMHFLKKIFAGLFIKNTIGAYVLQVDKALFAFVVLPLLASRLGIPVFGVFSAFLSLSVTVGAFVDWGLSQTAIQALAIANNREKSHIAGAVILAKLTLTIPVALIVVAVCFLLPPFNDHPTLGLLTVLTMYAVSLSPVFLFQAEEKSLEIGALLLVMRLMSIVFIFVLIKTPDDLNLSFFIYLIFIYMAVGAGWVVLAYKYKFKIYITSSREVLQQITGGFDFAFANIGSSLYGNGSVFLLSLVCSSAQVGLFGLALTFARGISSVLTPVSQSYLPKISRLYEESFAKARNIVRKILVLQALVACGLVAIVWIILFYLVRENFHNNSRELFQLIIILSPVIVSTLISSMLVLFVVIPLETNRFYRNLVAVSSLFGSVCLLLLGYMYQSYGAALTIMITETIVCLVIVNHSMRTIGSKAE